ncbi:MAG TPA: sigma 54-interacting transcriptional regulator [Longimicrobiales bacterium]|nr:sigma 54-interacting transcriptional regulator [Longimicrobiales bacterium]
MPVLAVLQRSDAFARVWAELAADLGLELRTAPDPAGLAPLVEACAILLVVPSEEQDAPGWVQALGAAGGRHVAVVGSAAEHRLAVAALRSGAVEYFALPADLAPLRSWVLEGAAAAAARLRAARLAASEREQFDFSRVIGESAGLRDALRVAARIIPRGSATVLLTGETGTGKEVLAHAIHYNGPRSAGAFVAVNCTALPANLLEAELFGYEKGAFTDARAAKPGLFEAAHGGTLFLDEIGDLPPELQAKLLRVLEERQVRRLGSLRTLAIDVRVVAATHVDLERAIREGRFREDLYFRLSVVPIRLPPLRERGADVLLLAERFLAEFAESYEVAAPQLTDEIRRALLAYEWPGNVRELRNALERAVLLGDGSLALDDLFRLPRGRVSGSESTLPFPASLAQIERAAAHRMVERLQGNKSAAAEVLGISRTRLYRLLEGDL